jgi:hypothetical protein
MVTDAPTIVEDTPLRSRVDGLPQSRIRQGRCRGHFLGTCCYPLGMVMCRQGEDCRVDSEMVSTQTLREHYGFWRWQVERASSSRLVGLWAKIGSASLDHAAKVSLANVAWALASFERSYDILGEDIVRAERARNEGVPTPIAVLSGPQAT